MVHPRTVKIHKNLSGDIPNIFQYQHFILIEKLHSQTIFSIKATLIVYLRVMKIYKNLPGNIPNIFPNQNIILSLRNCIHNSSP